MTPSAETVVGFIKYVAPWLYGKESWVENSIEMLTREGQKVNKNRRIKVSSGREYEAIKRDNFGHSSMVFAARQHVASSVREEQRLPKACLSLNYGLPCAAQVTFPLRLELY